MAETCKMKYTVLDSPLGKMELSGCERGLHGIRFLRGKTPSTELLKLLGLYKERRGVGSVQSCLWETWHQKELICACSIRRLGCIPYILDVCADSFTRQVLWKLLKVVKFGEMVSYQQLAALAGNPKAARAVGGAMRSNPVPILIPCHRVICSDGTLGNYSGGGQAVKEWLLTHEGIPTRQPTCKALGLTGTWLRPSRGSTSSKPSGRK
ncbi:Methylated-DNA--protein-cysteine methyltransferase [Microtus ochrogaster]|uniref:Methylated-DNA--protein-cysteine methyltransferase n=1 Tax=Microtus ochrogaster TaxID=79684 RepID=A0A8J6GBN6_MICOH|nr:Methylated-DNA--protein-cysteine methyltransferase [Microtus ochrogaster]